MPRGVLCNKRGERHGQARRAETELQSGRRRHTGLCFRHIYGNDSACHAACRYRGRAYHRAGYHIVKEVTADENIRSQASEGT